MDKPTLTLHNMVVCPSCSAQIHASFSAIGDAPQLGTIGICSDCGALLEFQEDGAVKTISEDRLSPYDKKVLLKVRRIIFEQKKNSKS